MKLVYFMRPVGQIGPIKIGCSKLPPKRLEALSIVSPLKLEIIAAVPGSHHDERTLHCMFQAHWLHHEWFSASKELLALVDYVSTYGLLPRLPEVVKFVLPRKAPQVRRDIPSGSKTAERGRRLVKQYESGATLKELAEREGVSPCAVLQGLRAVGCKMRRRGAPARGEHSVADIARAEEFRRRYLAGETLQEIAAVHGLTRERVRQVLRKFGVASLGHRSSYARLRQRQAAA